MAVTVRVFFGNSGTGGTPPAAVVPMRSLMGVGLGVRLLAVAQLRGEHHRRGFFRVLTSALLGVRRG